MASQADTEPMDYGGDQELSASQKAFVVEHKLAGRKYPSISRRFQEKYGIEAPTRRHVYNLVKKLKTKYTLHACAPVRRHVKSMRGFVQPDSGDLSWCRKFCSETADGEQCHYNDNC